MIEIFQGKAGIVPQQYLKNLFFTGRERRNFGLAAAVQVPYPPLYLNFEMTFDGHIEHSRAETLRVVFHLPQISNAPTALLDVYKAVLKLPDAYTTTLESSFMINNLASGLRNT